MSLEQGGCRPPCSQNSMWNWTPENLVTGLYRQRSRGVHVSSVPYSLYCTLTTTKLEERKITGKRTTFTVLHCIQKERLQVSV